MVLYSSFLIFLFFFSLFLELSFKILRCCPCHCQLWSLSWFVLEANKCICRSRYICWHRYCGSWQHVQMQLQKFAKDLSWTHRQKLTSKSSSQIVFTNCLHRSSSKIVFMDRLQQLSSNIAVCLVICLLVIITRLLRAKGHRLWPLDHTCAFHGRGGPSSWA